jgi:D-3-phosphoglycerate dehydrogenase
MKILVADKFEQAGLDGLNKLGAEVAYEPGAGAGDLGAALAKARPDVLVVRSSKVTPAALQSSVGLRAIVRAGAGVDNIDLPAAAAKGIAVANCPGMNSIAVAELVFAHLLCCDRRVPEQTAALRSGQWNKKDFTVGARGLKGSTLGIIGLGSIGQAVARRALAFEMTVIGWDKFLSPSWAREAGVRWAGSDRDAVLKMVRECDAITVHVALVPETKRFCNAEFFDAMKPGAYFINTSRGGVVDEAALIAAIKGKKIRAGLDVYENQPGAPQGEFRTPMAEVASSLTHHCGASTAQAQSAVADEVVRLVKVFMQTGRLENSVPAPSVTVEVPPRAPVAR